MLRRAESIPITSSQMKTYKSVRQNWVAECTWARSPNWYGLPKRACLAGRDPMTFRVIEACVIGDTAVTL
jgi:hypothetical protein